MFLASLLDRLYIINSCFICLLQLAATLAIPFWQWFLTKFGKKTAVYFGTSVRFVPQIDDVDSYGIRYSATLRLLSESQGKTAFLKLCVCVMVLKLCVCDGFEAVVCVCVMVWANVLCFPLAVGGSLHDPGGVCEE